jgi:tRNA pseudouridine38-40 synthase
MKRVVLGLQYDGSPWQGWQTQLCGLTIQDQLEAALEKFSCAKQRVYCAGRTDAGVHALEQVVHFDTNIERPVTAWVRGVNNYLPPSIAVRWASILPADQENGFHARFCAQSRVYHYALYNHPIRSPLLYQKAGWVFQSLDVPTMQLAAQALLGTHDFSAFRAAGCQAKSPIKTMQKIQIERRDRMIFFTFQANAFLHHMIRNIVGTLIYIGKGQQSSDWVSDLLACRDRTRAAPTFMADGLYLAKIHYDQCWSLPSDAGAALPWHDMG